MSRKSERPATGIGDLINTMLMEGTWTTEEIVAEAQRQFPHRRPSAKNVYWYACKLRALGHLGGRKKAGAKKAGAKKAGAKKAGAKKAGAKMKVARAQRPAKAGAKKAGAKKAGAKKAGAKKAGAKKARAKAPAASKPAKKRTSRAAATVVETQVLPEATLSGV